MAVQSSNDISKQKGDLIIKLEDLKNAELAVCAL